MPAFLILAHHAELAVSDLFRYVYDPASRFLLHIDAKAPLGLHRLANGLAAAFDNVELVPSRPCSWGGYSLVTATRDAITQALARPDFGHLILLSEQHLPLLSPAGIAAALTPGISDIQMQPVTGMDEAGGKDVEDRHGWHYRELPGVGMFATTPRHDVPFDIHHGSQWVVLAEPLCRTVAAAPTDIWEFFATTALADETALQTIAAMAGAANSGRNRSWVATPERIGNQSLTFAAPHFLQAREAGFLFIRKRPDELPATVRATLDSHAAFSAEAFADILSRHPFEPAATKPLFSPAELSLHLRWHLLPLTPDLAIEAITPPVNAPACYITLRNPAVPADMRLSLLSADMRHFKILLSQSREFDGDYSPKPVYGLPASIIRARVWGLQYQRELHIPNAPDHGFVEMPGPAALGPLITALRVYLAAVAKIS